VSFNPQGTILAAGGPGGRIRLWGVATGAALAGFPQADPGAVRSVALSPDGALLAAGGDLAEDDLRPAIQLWDVAQRRPVGRPLAGHQKAAYTLVFSPDGKTLASGSYDDTVILWDVATRRMRGRPLTYHAGTVFALAFSPDGTLLASAGYDRRIALWDVATGRLRDSPSAGAPRSGLRSGLPS
jgi:WD40 repeat protein